MPQITSGHLKLYKKYGGLIDGFERIEPKTNTLFAGEDISTWGMIDSALQSIELVSKKLVSKEFTAQTFSVLKTNCDETAFTEMTNRIPFYEDFQKIAFIVSEIKDKLNIDTDFAYTHFNDLSAAEAELSEKIENLKLCNFEALSKVMLDFLPTSNYQELSMQNGWSDEYFKIAEKFDVLHEAIYKEIVPSDLNVLKPKN